MVLINTNSKVFNYVVAQLAHFAWGALLSDASQHYHLPWWSLTLAWATPKEYLFDAYVEGAGQLDNTIDFAFYIAGLLVRHFWLK